MIRSNPSVFEGPTLSILGRLLGGMLVGGGLVLGGGCDSVPAPDRDQRRPSVTSLQVSPDSLHESDLAPEEIEDSLAQVEVDVSARAADPDGTVERVVFVFEPSSNPRGTLSGTLPPANNATRYGGRLGLSLPLVDEVYTVRVFAVDDDSLSGNQVTGQFRFVPTDTSGAGGGGNAPRMQLHRRPDDS
ncbi:hypothetical protein GGP50_001494 [Salinibacter ruber]|uniref:hypothetical protein n=1 Tax=Salinibacter ruber TaxID=146919 RepID=UPI002168778C|nr:hypothetical protein [Salinibacter ruber]MCS3667271.1 hypothetical protein [Salinibacter ruber]MCS4193278.1 hypothetical protein [Salinibacter ruber]